jgi:hypothetical protein
MTSPYSNIVLRRAIERGLSNGQLQEELDDLGEITLTSRADAEAVSWGLRRLDSTTPNLLKATHALLHLFQRVADAECEAATVLTERGIPELLRLFDVIQGTHAPRSANTQLVILKIAALYGTTEGALKIIEAARQPLEPDAYIWSAILCAFQAGHPQNDLLYGSLKDPLPPEFIRVALLEAANMALIGGESMTHPFDTLEGRSQIRRWLQTTNPDEQSFAQSATAGLPFLSQPDQDLLLGIALHHPNVQVRMEAAWAAARIGREDGLTRLVAHCRDLRTSQPAQKYLRELDREELIPPEALEPGFAAMAEFAEWCAHPNELGRAPDELDIVDHRNLRWPPERESRPFWLIKYKLRDTSGLEEDEEDCGLVGSVTFCLFSYKLSQRPPEDAYAVHCYWEMEQKGLITESDLIESPDEAYANLISQWQGPPLKNVKMTLVAELSPELGYPQRLVALAAASLKRERGWVVLDGHSSAWYPRSEQPANSPPHVALKVHVGRNLLGFSGKPNRKLYLPARKRRRTPEQIASAYEKLLTEAVGTPPPKQSDLFRALGPLSTHFDDYIQALVQLDRATEVRRVVEIFAKHWHYPGEYSTLASAALRAGHLDLAETFLLRFREACADYEHCPEMLQLAGVWCNIGKAEDARELLLHCMQKVLADCRSGPVVDLEQLRGIFLQQRAEFLRRFPELGEQFLQSRGIPRSNVSQENEA